MTRIIGGSARGRRLRTPPGDATRPTTDRVREALFSSLEARLGSVGGLSGRRFLDLYAGSGAVGLEAMSRGAASVIAVESDRRTARLIQANARAIGLAVEATVQPVRRFLTAEDPVDRVDPFDVAFLDPPYHLPGTEVDAVLAMLGANRWLVAGGIVVVERSVRSAEPAWPQQLVDPEAKKYGETVLWYVHRVVATQVVQE